MVEITENEFRQLADYIHKYCGINLKSEKKALVNSRLQNTLYRYNMQSFTEYFTYLTQNSSESEITEMIDKLTTNHTFFMRESEHFRFYEKDILPKLKNTVTDRDMRIWCAACSTGEEAYTLAILNNEFLGREKLWWDTKVLATDISVSALDIARKATYSKENTAPLPNEWKRDYFYMKEDDQWEVKDFLKKEVIFRRFNLMEEVYPFKKKFHVIFCRNVMIYFDQADKDKLIRKLQENLAEGGYLFIGHSEAINKEDIGLQYVMPSVYRKTKQRIYG
ncbi:CheR family methyltransferase [Anaerocolumna xylanovorans]|uniref:protein-glutamate O-methyltransferase n=1 Tax=Anaerocolumna xylanovorans DSM 12503 TaxID=1121345 RepID=A0A1M7YKX6_9FIRM|nr:protein-glutamate O-methyltransferase CheR [Anaerocolumna xylanovorans]SHO53277.1 chemotaxis protein methyltransferase CheR [Anaerocolumna xylanovorans DSM 12503]